MRAHRISNVSMTIEVFSAVNVHQVIVLCLALTNVKSAPVCGCSSYLCMHWMELILAGLFFLNFTLLQETIMGVVMHTNIMGLKGDFLQEHAWGPLLFILSVLSLKSGAIVPNLVSEHVFIMAWMSSGRLYCSLPSPSTSSPSSQSSSDNHCHSQVQLYIQDVRKGLFHVQESCTSTGHHHGNPQVVAQPLHGCPPRRVEMASWFLDWFEVASTSHPCGHPHIH